MATTPHRSDALDGRLLGGALRRARLSRQRLSQKEVRFDVRHGKDGA